MARRYAMANLDGRGIKRHLVFDMPIIDPQNYWANVTDVDCPACLDGTIRWE